MSFTNTSGSILAEQGWNKPKKWAYFDSLSTTTKIASIPWEGGKSVIKCMEISSQILDGMGNG